MKSSLVKLNQFIPLLTDTLPYEVPFFFSNKGLYESLKSSYDLHFNANNIKKAKGDKSAEPDIDIYEFFVKKYFALDSLGQLRNKIQTIASDYTTIPYLFEIKKNEFDHRVISLIHPLAQMKVCDLYKKHKDLILFSCKRGRYSLRFPEKVTTRLVTRHANLLNKIFKDEGEANTADIKQQVVEDHELITMSEIPNSYFVYDKYKKLHDFYDSTEYIELEKRFSCCAHFDVKRCFDSIYSHTIAWAVKGKEYAKENRFDKENEAFENEFDRLMQFSNYGETNGIPIGSEASRIFAEVILQKIDLNIQNKISSTKIHGEHIVKGKDFEIKRYIDGYYVFSNNELISKRIQKICENELKEFKLFVNEAKSDFKTRPFTTNITSAKQKVKQLLRLHLRAYNEGNLPHDAKPIEKAFSKYIHYKVGLSLIQDLRCVAHDYEISFYEIANICLGKMKTDLLKRLSILQDMPEADIKNKQPKIKAYLRNIISISFYIFSTSPRSHTCSTTFKIMYVVLEILKIIKDEGVSGEIKQEIFSQYLKFFENLSVQENVTEFLDIILLVNELGENFKLSEDRLKHIFRIYDTKDKGLKSDLYYFELIVLLAYIKNGKEFSYIRKHIIETSISKLKQHGLKKTENFLLFFDLVKCPYLTDEEKKKILSGIGLDKNKIDVIDFVKSKSWFFDWNKQEHLHLKNVLEIKEASNNY